MNGDQPPPVLAVRGAVNVTLASGARAALLAAPGGDAPFFRLRAALRGEGTEEGIEVALQGRPLPAGLARPPFLHLPDAPLFPPRLSPRAVLGLIPRPRLAPAAALDAVGLTKRAATPCGVLSSAERQRLALAALLLRRAECPLLLAEEPEEGFGEGVRELLARLLAAEGPFAGAAFLLLARRAESVFALAREVGMLGAEGLAAWGAPQRLYEDPPDLATARALGPVNLLPARLVVREEDGAEVECEGGARFWSAHPPAGVAVGERTCLMIRPERIAMAALAADELEGGAIAAVITRVEEGGADAVFHLRLESGALWQVRRPAAMRRTFRPGQRVALAWPEEAVRLYPFSREVFSPRNEAAEGGERGMR